MTKSAYRGSMSGTVHSPPSAQSPFARLGCYLRRRDVSRPVSRHYPAFIAHMGSCARPNPSHRLRSMPRSAGLCRLSPVPAGRWPFPALSLQSLRGCSAPYPAVSSRCTCSLLPRRRRPHPEIDEFGTRKIYPVMQLQQGSDFEAAGIRSSSGSHAR